MGNEENSQWNPPTGTNPYTTEQLISRFTNPKWVEEKLKTINDEINKIRYDNAKTLESITFIKYYDNELFLIVEKMYLGSDTIKIVRYNIDECGRTKRSIINFLSLNGNIKANDKIYISEDKEFEIVECLTFRKKDWIEILKLKA